MCETYYQECKAGEGKLSIRKQMLTGKRFIKKLNHLVNAVDDLRDQFEEANYETERYVGGKDFRLSDKMYSKLLKVADDLDAVKDYVAIQNKSSVSQEKEN